MTTSDPFRVPCVIGARPNFAPIMRAFRAEPLQGIILHTGQHCDKAMKAAFFEQISITEPDVDLGAGFPQQCRPDVRDHAAQR
jgi:UDP-N-acetylglucosamine 2-epimerase (non-hydrolysing)